MELENLGDVNPGFLFCSQPPTLASKEKQQKTQSKTT